jgi:hypothetical protein
MLILGVPAGLLAYFSLQGVRAGLLVGLLVAVVPAGAIPALEGVAIL